MGQQETQAYHEARKQAQRAQAADQQKLAGGPGALAYVASVRRLCACEHPVLLHEISDTTKKRTWCTYMDSHGKCGCLRCVIQ